ncbi:MAG TPA: hypothetical protein DCS01_00760 [Idiomarina abyssalis]|uniref:DUF4747 family protein n=1 Tax=Idiomarina aquatica TaxID=1327752 RepID=A0AA94EEQ6_9GAMM|nr:MULTISPECIES: DUF4747 family protein [Idiomarina]MAB22056.1 hypothetical protein [Idiomarina sp.]MBH93295.1 hypothetical protein [Idiomarina sp.]RUO40305.1 hypothetical protein CWE23_11920 [Idiomarina aquatica]HAS13810.1 hypothetical protein [Idiomarina abyssalis]|tara:strand:+ start:12816 stop:13706 length:891 start_codon:yes stop_codon:yes gene_type:complete
MAKIYFFNTQVKPLKTSDGFIGEAGYNAVFEFLSDSVSEAVKTKKLHNLGSKLYKSKFHLVFRKVEVLDGYAQGLIRKYDKINSLKDFYTDNPIYEAAPGEAASSSATDFKFVFDYSSHILAIEDVDNKFPNPSSVEQSVIDLLEPFVHRHRSDASTSCNVLKETSSLSRLMNSDGFKSIKIELTFSNPNGLEDEFEAEIEKDLRDRNVDKLVVQEKAASGGHITELNHREKALFKLAGRFGDASARFLNEENKLETYQMKEHPVKIQLRHGRKDTTESIFGKIKSAINSALNRAS